MPLAPTHMPPIPVNPTPMSRNATVPCSSMSGVPLEKELPMGRLNPSKPLTRACSCGT
jgi:hypothetical protein